MTKHPLRVTTSVRRFVRSETGRVAWAELVHRLAAAAGPHGGGTASRARHSNHRKVLQLLLLVELRRATTATLEAAMIAVETRIRRPLPRALPPGAPRLCAAGSGACAPVHPHRKHQTNPLRKAARRRRATTGAGCAAGCASLALADGVGTAGQKMLAHQLPHPHLHRQSQQGRLMRPPMRKRTRVSALA